MPLQVPSKHRACMGEAGRSAPHPVRVPGTSMLPRELSVHPRRMADGILC